jgi:tetratricopeptide (TPR) repeat protein
MNRLDEAWREFDLALSMDPHQPHTLYLYGRARFQHGELARAAELFDRACRDREHHEARYFAAQTHTALGEHAAALAAYRQAFRAIEQHVELNPDDARACTMAAVALGRLRERERGLEWVDRALQIDPSDAGIQYNAACLFALEEQPARALECLEAAASSGFAHRDWVDRDPDLDSLRGDPRFKAIRWRDSSPSPA